MDPTPEGIEAATPAEEEARKQAESPSVLSDTVTQVDAASSVFDIVWSAGEVVGTVGRGVCDAVVGVCGAVGDSLPDL